MSDNFWKVRKGLTLNPTLNPTNPVDGDVYFDSIQGFLGYNNGSWGPLGGGGIINYNTNPTIGSTVGYNLYNNGPVHNPTTGTGGVVTNLTFTSTNVSPLVGHTMGILSKGAANSQGEGLSYDFTIDPAFAPGIINISFQYQASANFQLSSGAFGSDSDLEIWIYDITNAVLIPVTPYVLTSGVAAPATFSGFFQTNLNSSNYRLIWHIATTNALAWTFNLANVVISPNSFSTVAAAPQVSVIYTSTTSQASGFFNFETKVEDTSAAVSNPATAWTFTAPVPGLYDIVSEVGIATITNPEITIGIYKNGSLTYEDYFSYAPTTTLNTSTEISAKVRLAAGDTIQIRADFGGGASSSLAGSPESTFVMVTLLQQDFVSNGNGPVVKARLEYSTTMPGSGSAIFYDTVVEDNYNAYNAGTATWTCPVAGTYILCAAASVAQTPGHSANAYIGIYINGVQVSAGSTDQATVIGSGTTILTQAANAYIHTNLAAGDTVQVVWNGTSSVPTYLGTVGNFLDIIQVNPPALQQVPAGQVSRIVKSNSTGPSFGLSVGSPSPILDQSSNPLSSTVICNGGDVEVGLQDDGSGGIGRIVFECTNPVNTWPQIHILFYRDGTLISTQAHMSGANTQFNTGAAPPSSFRFIDTPPVGTHVYTVQAYEQNQDGGTGNAQAMYLLMFARPLA